MTNWKAVIIGFILIVIVESFFANYEFVGLLVVGFITGYISHDGSIGGLLNAAVAGAFGTIVCAVIFILIVTFGGGSLLGIFGGLAGFTVAGVASIIEIVKEIIYYAIVMGITGAIGGAIASKE